MSTRLYVGNLPYSTTSDELRELFSEFGDVTDAHVVMDRETGRPRGFAFVSLATEETAKAAAEAVNGRRIGGRPLVVNVARERGAPPPRGARPSGSAPAGPRPGRPPGRPPGPSGFPPAGPPPDPEESGREVRRRPKKRKGRGGEPQRDRNGGVRQHVIEEEKRGGSSQGWRQWLDDDEEDLGDLKNPWDEAAEKLEKEEEEE